MLFVRARLLGLIVVGVIASVETRVAYNSVMVTVGIDVRPEMFPVPDHDHGVRVKLEISGINERPDLWKLF